MTSEATLSIRYVRGLVSGVAHAGVSRERFLRAAQLEPAQLGVVEGRVSCSQFFRLCELALDVTGDPALGLHTMEVVTGDNADIVARLVAHASTLRRSLETLAYLDKLMGDRDLHRLVEHEGEASVHCVSLDRGPSRAGRFLAEMHVAGLYRLFRFFVRDERPVRVNLEYSAPDYRAEYARIFEGLDHFDQPFTGIVFDRALLDSPSPFPDEELYCTLRALAERRIARLAQDAGYAHRVRQVFYQQTAPAKVDMSTVARALGLSARSLRRHLATEGTSYSEVANDALATIARNLLSVERRTILETAEAMGYTDTSSFHRAFKRWTGTTPHRCRVP